MSRKIISFAHLYDIGKIQRLNWEDVEKPISFSQDFAVDSEKNCAALLSQFK
jgi:hypothetical protein